MYRGLISLIIGSLIMPSIATPTQAQTTLFCRFTPEAITEKHALRQAAFQGDQDAAHQYIEMIRLHGTMIQRCRQQTWPQQQALWVRLYPCDARTGAIEQLFDQIVNWGYNAVYVEVFYNGQVLLPVADNQTPWPSVIRHPAYHQTDLLAHAVAKGRERGLTVYAWMFSMNFGYSYAQRSDRQDALALNGDGQTSVAASEQANGVGSEEAFIDPYNPTVLQDYSHLIQTVLKRQPDGVLFDYIRYPRIEGGATIASRVQDLWIYGTSSQQALSSRALNESGREFIQRFLRQGYLTEADVLAIDEQYATEGDAQWQGRSPTVNANEPVQDRREAIQNELWQLGVAHARQGVLDFLTSAVHSVSQYGIPAGAVFFPDANATINSGYDARLQPWDRFPQTIEWHPMAYRICDDAQCIVSEVQQVLSFASSPSQVNPVLAGGWGQTVNHHPPLETQMAAIHSAVPEIQSVSHFAYSWQDPEADRNRKFCNL